MVRRRQQAGFVARTSELAQFRANLNLPAAAAERQFVFTVHGDGGVGKSFLLGRWRSIAEGADAVTCWVDEPVFSVPDAMRAMAADLARQGVDTSGFVKLLDGYQQRRFEAETDPEAPAGLAAFMTQTAVRMGLQAAQAVPGVGVIAGAVDANALAAQADQLRVYLGRKFRRREDVRLLLSPLDVLTPVMVRDLAEAGRRRPLALFFDTYEQTGLVLDGWLRSVLDGAHGELPDNLVVAIAGRSPLDPDAWAAYLPLMADVPIEPFTETEAEHFLAERGITDERVRQVIISVSGRLPLLLATLAQNRPDDPNLVGDPTGDAVERFLKWETDPARRSLAVAAALPRIVNEDTMAVLLGEVDAEQLRHLFAWLRALPFVTDDGGRCHYHDVVREAMIRLERRQSPIRWRGRHAALAEAYQTWRTGQSVQDAWDDQDWRALRLEETYHRLCADPALVRSAGIGDVVRACAEYPEAAPVWAQVIAQAGQDADARSLRSWGRRLEDSLRSDGSEAIAACLTEILTDDRLPQDVRTLALRTRGRVLTFLDRHTEALADLDQAVALSPDDATAVAYRGAANLWLKRWDEALADLDRALELRPDIAEAVAERGEVYRLTGQYEAALADFDRAIELAGNYPFAIIRRGVTYRRLGRFDRALTDLDRFIELDPASAAAFAQRGAVYRRLGRYEEALADLGRAAEMDQRDGWVIEHCVEICLLTDTQDLTLAELDRLIELDPADSQVLAWRGELYMWMNRYDLALHDFDRVISLTPDWPWALVQRGVVCMRVGRHEQAMADFSRALEHDPSYAPARWGRGEAYRRTGRYEQALADLDCAVAREPSWAWWRYQRSLAYIALGRTAAAHEDLRSAIHLARSDIGSAQSPSDDTYNFVVYLAASGDHRHAVEYISRELAEAPNRWLLTETIDDLKDLAGIPGVDQAATADLIAMLDGMLVDIQ